MTSRLVCSEHLSLSGTWGEGEGHEGKRSEERQAIVCGFCTGQCMLDLRNLLLLRRWQIHSMDEPCQSSGRRGCPCSRRLAHNGVREMLPSPPPHLDFALFGRGRLW